MTINEELRSCGEPAADETDVVLADFLEECLDRLERGADVRVASLLRDRPDLVRQGEELLDDVMQVFRLATSLHDRSGLDGAGSLAVAELEEAKKLAAGTLMGTTFPDPFPGEFRIRGLLGRGTFGEVWLAEDLNMPRAVALKTLRRPAAAAGGPGALAALRNEARMLADLRHPNIVQVYFWRPAGEDHYLALQYVAGGSLEDRVIKEGPLPWQPAARYIADVGEGLLEVQRLGIVHRDIKPANMLWDPIRDEALLTDFGVAALLAEPGNRAGTPYFMAPEAFAGQLTAAMDVYSLAASLFRLATGTVPFGGDTTDALLKSIQRGLPALDPRLQVVPEELERVIRAGLVVAPQERPPLPEFVMILRGALDQALADTLPPSAAQVQQRAPVNLRLVVHRLKDGLCTQAATTRPGPGRLLRDVQLPPAPRHVRLATGERVRLEVVADLDGYVTVFNVGPTGNLNLLYPAEWEGTTPPAVEPHRPVQILDAQLLPPAGRERVFALWTRTPLPLRPEELLGLAEGTTSLASRPYFVTRDLKRVRESVRSLPPEDWHAVVLELDHCPS